MDLVQSSLLHLYLDVPTYQPTYQCGRVANMQMEQI